MMRVMSGSMALGLRAIVVAGCLGALVGCVEKEGTEVQARGTADTLLQLYDDPNAGV